MWRIAGSEQAATALRRSLAEHARDPDPFDWPLRMVLFARDELRAALAEDLGAASGWQVEPSSTGSKRWDALLGAIVAHEFVVAGYRAPRWATRRRLRRSWVLPHPIWDADEVKRRTPDWLRVAGIFMPARDLETA